MKPPRISRPVLVLAVASFGLGLAASYFLNRAEPFDLPWWLFVLAPVFGFASEYVILRQSGPTDYEVAPPTLRALLFSRSPMVGSFAKCVIGFGASLGILAAAPWGSPNVLQAGLFLLLFGPGIVAVFQLARKYKAPFLDLKTVTPPAASSPE